MTEYGLHGENTPPAKRKPGWDGAIGKAEKLHQQYLAELDKWGKYQKKHGDKIQLWDAVRKILIKSRSADGISTSHLYDALGVTQYHEAEGNDWDYTKGLYAALELGEEATMAELAEKAGSVNDGYSCSNEFIRFGREVVTRRADVEIAAGRLIHYMRYGKRQDDVSFAPTKTGVAEKTKPNLSHKNEFYSEFIRYDLDDQIIIAKELTYGLANSKRGKDFLANLFEYQVASVFDPFGFVKMRYMKRADGSIHDRDGAIKEARWKYISVFTKDPLAYKQKYLTEDNRYKLDAKRGGQTDSIPEHLAELLAQLYPGLMHFHATRSNNTTYQQNVVEGSTAPNLPNREANPDPDAVVGKFTKEVTSLFLNDDHVRTAIDDVDWSKTAYDKPDWSKDYLKGGSDAASWGPNQTKYIAKISVAATDGLAGALPVSGGRFILPVNLLFTAMGGYTAYRTLTGSEGDAEAFKKLRLIGKNLTNLDGLERFLPDDVDDLGDAARKASKAGGGKSAATSATRKALKILGTLGVCLDIVLTIIYVGDIGREMEGGDYDAAGGYALWGLSGLASIGSWGAGLAAGGSYTTAGAIAGLVSGGLVVIALVLGALGAAVLAWCDESAISEWLRYTRFGAGWSDLSDAKVRDPEDQQFRYKKFTNDPQDPLGAPDYRRQLSALHSLVRPIGLSKAVVDEESRSGHSGTYPRGTLAMKPFENGVWSKKTDVDILTEGVLYVRPVTLVKTETGLETSTVVSGEVIHRINLDDGPGSQDYTSNVSLSTVPDWKTALGVRESDSYLEMIERYTGTDVSPTELDLEITDAAATVNDDGETVITSWEATLWAMAGDGADVFGWPPGEILEGLETDSMHADTRKRYLEVIYVPPNVAEWMQTQDVVIPPQTLPTVTKERIAIDHVDHDGSADVPAGGAL